MSLGCCTPGRQSPRAQEGSGRRQQGRVAVEPKLGCSGQMLQQEARLEAPEHDSDSKDAARPQR